MNRFSFVANLRPASVDHFRRVRFEPAAWLLSTHRLDTTTVRLAAEVRTLERPLFADNGTKELIDAVVEQFEARAKPLQRRIRRLRHSIGPNRRIPTASEVPADLAHDASDLAHEVVDSAEKLAEATPLSETLEAQLSMQPTHLVAKEDFASACLLALGLEREITRWPPAYFDRRNERSLEWWADAAGDRRCSEISVYVTLSATDYNTAHRAGELAGRHGARCVALGFAGINSDASWADSFLHRGRLRLPRPAPRRYTRTAAILAGIADGIHRSGGRLDAFHALGLGAAPQFPILAAALPESTSITTDATSPIHDAVRDLVTYDTDARGDRVTALEAAHRVLDGGRWPCAGPFCGDVRARLGHDVDAARSWWVDEGHPPVTRRFLEPPHPVVEALPLFGAGRRGTTAAAFAARIGHNHWALDVLAERGARDDRRAWGADELDVLAQAPSVPVRFGAAGARYVLATIGRRPAESDH